MAALEFYSTVDQVKRFTGITPDDLDLKATETETPAQQLDAEIEEWLKDIKSLIDEYVGRDFAREEEESRPEGGGEPTFPVPRAIHMLAKRAARNMFAMAKVSRRTGVVTEDELAEGPRTDTVLTNDIRADLKLFRRTITGKRTSRVPHFSVIPGADRSVS